jgi:hypothetical protein
MKKILTVFLVITYITPYAFSEILAYEIPPGIYYVLDYPINIRQEPNLQGKILGQLSMVDEFEVYYAVYEDEYNKYSKVENIDGGLQWWYRIKFNEIYGYIYGGYIAMKRIVFDIDKNGIMDYFCFRFGAVWGRIYDGKVSYDPGIHPSDVYIYINNKRIDNAVIGKEYGEMLDSRDVWVDCEFVNFQNMANGTVKVDMDFLRKDSRGELGHQKITLDLTSYK